MSKDMQNAVNNFVMGFSLGDRIVARREASEAAKQKWQTMLEWRKADLAEKAKRNASYDAQSKAHSDLMAAQADWYRKRGPGGSGGKISIGPTGKPAYSAAGQAYIDKQVAAGLQPPGAQPASESPSISVDLPEQPPPPIAPLGPPPSDDSSDATTGALFSDARGGRVSMRFARGGRVPLATMGIGGTSGPGSGYGVRAAPPSYADGGSVSDFGTIKDKVKRNLEEIERALGTLKHVGEGRPGFQSSPQLGGTGPSLPYPQATRPTAPASAAPAGGGGAGATTEPDVPYQDAPAPPSPSVSPEPPPRLASGTAYASEPDVPPQPAPTPVPAPAKKTGGKGGGSRGAIDTGEWKGLQDQTRTKAFDYSKDQLDPDNYHYTTDTGQVAPWAQQDWAKRWNSNNLFPTQGQPPPEDRAQTWARGGPVRRFARGGAVRRFADGGPLDDPNADPQQAPAPAPEPAPTPTPAIDTSAGGPQPAAPPPPPADTGPGNAHNDLSPIMKSASDFAAHAFHLIENDQHSAAGYHAIMAGHGAAPINLIEQGFQKIDPDGKMPINQKVEQLTENLYDYYVARKEPDKAAKVAFEVAQFSNTMAKQHGAQAGDLLQKGDFNGAMNQLIGGYNWLVDGHTADYDPRSRMVTLRDSKSGEVTGQLPATPQLIQNLSLGMMSGELNWDIMRGRGGAQPPAQQPPGAQAPPGPPASSPSVQPVAAPAGPPQQTPAAPTFTTPPVVTPPQGDGGPPGSPAGDGNGNGDGGDTQVAQAPPQAVQPTPPPQITPRGNTVITSTPPPPGPSSPVRAAPPPAQPAPTQPAPKPPAQGDQTEPVEGSEDWYNKHPHDVPNRVVRRASGDLPPPPDIQGERNKIEQWRRNTIAQQMLDAKGLSQSDKSLVPQFNAQVNAKADKLLSDLESRRKEWLTMAKDQDHQESQRITNRAVQAQSSESNVETKMEDYLDKKYQTFAKMDPVEEAARARDVLKKTGRLDARGEDFATVNQSPLRFMDTPDKRARLKEIATQIWSANPSNPPMSERQAIEHALNFTSIMPPDGKGHNNAKGDDATTYRLLGTDPLGNVVVENEAHERVHMHPQTLQQIVNMRLANADEFAQSTGERRRQKEQDAKHGNMLERTGRQLRKVLPLDPIISGPARAIGELIPESKK